MDINLCLLDWPLVLVIEDEADWNWGSDLGWTTMDMVCL